MWLYVIYRLLSSSTSLPVPPDAPVSAPFAQAAAGAVIAAAASLDDAAPPHESGRMAVTTLASVASVLREPSPLHGLSPALLTVLALGCLALAAAVAGLTLGLMTLDSTSLDIVMQSNDQQQAAAARAIKPIREQGNLLLVTLLLSNTLAAELLPLVMEALMPGGYLSLVVSIFSLMLFGEMIPQSVCARHPLYFGHRLIGFVKVLRIIMYPIAAPIAFMLDKLLGEELGTIYNREELKGLIDFHASKKILTQDETTILKGTLEFSLKAVDQILTPSKIVFKLNIDTVLDRNTLLAILRSGHSRVPLYDGSPDNIVCLLLVKQLILVNPDDRVPIRALISKRASNHKVRVAPALECSAATLIADLLNEFQLGRSHMALVYDDVAKPLLERKFLGTVSIEDIIEEILQEEIVDETDIFIDNTNMARVLVRNADGQLVRATALSTTAAQTGVLGRPAGERETMRVREIDVPALRAPLERRNGDREKAASAATGSTSNSARGGGTTDVRLAVDASQRRPAASESALQQYLGTDASENERTVLLQRTSADGVASNNTGSLLRRISRPVGVAGSAGPALNARRSMMSMLCDEDNVLPEDIALAERDPVQFGSGGGGGGGGKGSKVKVRPLPSNASAEREEVPIRLRKKVSKRLMEGTGQQQAVTAAGYGAEGLSPSARSLVTPRDMEGRDCDTSV